MVDTVKARLTEAHPRTRIQVDKTYLSRDEWTEISVDHGVLDSLEKSGWVEYKTPKRATSNTDRYPSSREELLEGQPSEPESPAEETGVEELLELTVEEQRKRLEDLTVDELTVLQGLEERTTAQKHIEKELGRRETGE